MILIVSFGTYGTNPFLVGGPIFCSAFSRITDDDKFFFIQSVQNLKTRKHIPGLSSDEEKSPRIYESNHPLLFSQQ